MNSQLLKLLFGSLLYSAFFLACRKGALDTKPQQNLTVPDRIRDLQALLDNTNTFNVGSSQPYMHELGTNDFYISSFDYGNRQTKDRNIYSWAATSNFYDGVNTTDWDESYEALFVANTVLENIQKVIPTSATYQDWANVKGSALFYRAWIFYNLAQLFCKPYIPSSAGSDLGIIMRTNPDINMPSKRVTVLETYSQIISDLMGSKDLLPLFPLNNFKTRPTKHAVFAMLSRVYLTMQDYSKSKQYADSALNISSVLMDFRNDPDINPALILPPANNPASPFYRYNKEVIFYASMPQFNWLPLLGGNTGHVDTSLVSLYGQNDRRRLLFFRRMNSNQRLAFGGTYSGTPFLFNGLATDEIYLNRAECYARNGNVALALQDLNALYRKRCDTTVAPFVPITASDAEDALRKIFLERRKELCFRGIRWTDLRRLNQEARFAVTLTRGLLNTSSQFLLTPNDNRYVYPIPDNEILYSGVPQNPR